MFEELEKAIIEIQQPRSRFQLEKFVLGQHATKEMQYYQVCLEIQDMLYKYRIAEINQKKILMKIAKLRSTGDEIKELKAQELELGLEQIRLGIVGAQRELAHLIDIWNSFEHKYTRDEIEAAQPDYWKLRLTNNANAMLMSGSGVNPAHIEAMEQAGILNSFIKLQTEKREEIE